MIGNAFFVPGRTPDETSVFPQRVLYTLLSRDFPMKKNLTASILLLALVAGSALLYQGRKTEPVTTEPNPLPPQLAERADIPEPELVKTVVEIPKKTTPEPQPEPAAQPEPRPKVELVQKAEHRPAPPKPDYSRYWKQQQRRFDQLANRLANEADPQKRQQLINAIARFVRVDTLATLDWVATLETPEDQRKALEAINKNALVGIGARIEQDKNGLPKIRETTIMSAIEATGMVAPGDYISGMIRPDGTMVDFEGMPLQKVVRHLRGKVGTEPTLMMKRYNDDGSTLQFDVSVPRSLLVVGDPNAIN